MSFRNMSQRQSYRVLRTRPTKPSDEKTWQDIYPQQVVKGATILRQFAVANWIPVVVGLVAGIGAAVGGFYIGQKYSTLNIAKKFAAKTIDLLPKKIQAQVRSYM